MKIKALTSILGLTLVVSACSDEVRLEGTRLPISSAMTADTPLDAMADPAPGAVSAPISLPATTSGEWAQTGGNGRHDMPHGALSAAPVLAFATPIGSGDSRRQRVFASPVTANGTVFTLDSQQMVSAVNRSGALIWQTSVKGDFDRDGGISGGGLATNGNLIFAATGYGEVVALNAASGAVAWRQRFDAPIAAAPAIDGGQVYIAARSGEFAALDVTSGKILWSNIGTPGIRTMLRGASPAIAGALVLFPQASGEVLAVKSTDGSAVWRAAVAGQDSGLAAAQAADITGDPVVTGNTVIAGSSGGRIVSFDATDGKRNWTVNTGALSTPLVTGGAVFAVNQRGELVRLNASDGSLVWAVPLPTYLKEKAARRKAVHAHFGPLLAGGRLVVGSSDNLLRFFDPRSGALVSSVEIPGGAASAPILAHGMLYVISGDGQLLAFR